MNALTNAFVIITPSGDDYHSLEDWGLAMGNNNYIGDPTLEEFYVDVPGGPVLDLSQALTKRPVFKQREIHIEVGGVRNRFDWDGEISTIRNLIDGQVCKIIFDNDSDWYWKGRVRITDFDREASIGHFTITMLADAYKYAVTAESDTYTTETAVITFPNFDIPVVPEFECTAGCDLSDGTEVYHLRVGKNRIPTLKTDTSKTWTLTGNTSTTVTCREMSL